jgi:predicted RNase H-like nuclease
MKTFKQYLDEVKKPTGDLKKACWDGYTAVGMKMKGGRKVPNCVPEEVELAEVAAWQRKEGKRESGGLNQKGVDSYRREHPGSKLKTAVTTKPSKLKAGSAAANRRKSFCARMSGMKKRLTSAKTAHDPDSRINKSLRKWNC